MTGWVIDMGAELSQQDLLYPSTICAHEMDYGIVRQEINGTVYIMADGPTMHAKMDKSKAKRDNDFRLWEFSKTPQSFTEWLRGRGA